MKTRTFRTSFSLAIGVAVFTALSVALPQPAQAQAADVAVLQSEMTYVKAAVIRIDERFDRMDDKFTKKFERIDATIAEIKETAARTDERINALQSQNSLIIRVLIAVFVPLHLVTLGALFALLTKGHLWGVAREPKAASGAPRPAQIPSAQPHPS